MTSIRSMKRACLSFMLSAWLVTTAGIVAAGETPKNCNPNPTDPRDINMGLSVAGATPLAVAGNGLSGTVAEGNLVWLKDLGCFSAPLSYPEADGKASTLRNPFCGLSPSDSANAGRWRLPSAGELKGRVGMTGGFSNVPATGCFWANDRSVVCRDGTTGSASQKEKHHVWPVYSK